MRLRARAALLLGLCAGQAAAEEAPICADRPGKATATCTVPAGRWQVETGIVDWSLDRSAGERETLLSVGETTVKYGLSGSANIAVDFTPWQQAGGAQGGSSGVGDLNVLFKQRLTAADAAVQVALVPFVKAPTAKHSLGNRKWEGGLLVPIGYAISKSPLALALTPEFDWVADGDGRGHHAAMAQVASLGWQASDTLNLSAELWGQWNWDPAGTTRQASADGAVAFLVGSSVQLDAGANFGLNRATPDVEIYGGVSARF